MYNFTEYKKREGKVAKRTLKYSLAKKDRLVYEELEELAEVLEPVVEDKKDQESIVKGFSLIASFLTKKDNNPNLITDTWLTQTIASLGRLLFVMPIYPLMPSKRRFLVRLVAWPIRIIERTLITAFLLVGSPFVAIAHVGKHLFSKEYKAWKQIYKTTKFMLATKTTVETLDLLGASKEDYKKAIDIQVKKIDKAVAKYEKLTGTKVNTFNFGNGSSDGASQNQVADLLKESAQYSEYEEEKNKDIESVKTK